MSKGFICERCFRDFSPYNRLDQRYCSPACARAASQARAKIVRLEKATAKLAAKIGQQTPVAIQPPEGG